VRERSFTFVLPTLNASGPLFERALTSIREQTHPQDAVEILVADGGSTDDTRDVAKRFGARVLENPNRLAEWGVKTGVAAASGDIVVVFAADNELVSRDWLATLGGLFDRLPRLSAVFGRLVSGRDDPPLNKYVELIQSEPLNWFLNRNLDSYLADHPPGPDGFAVFEVDPARPLIWGANGLAVRREHAVPAWSGDDYVADVDAFHAMVRAGNRLVAYTPRPYCYHHQVATLRDMRRKWSRNARQHLVQQAPARDLDWVLGPQFRRRVLLWTAYSSIPLVSGVDAVRRALKDGSPYWLYHPAASLVQTFTYATALMGSADGRALLRRALRTRPR
jgi:glycosyltransferase involved in cell wall biosynthesis